MTDPHDARSDEPGSEPAARPAPAPDAGSSPTGGTAPAATGPVPGAAGASGPSAPARPIKKDSIWEVYYPRDVTSDRHAVPVASFPMIVYFWPTMLAFLVCGMLQAWTGAAPATLGWIATAALGLNLLVIVTDLDQKKFLIAVLLIVVVGLLAWITTLKEMTLVPSVRGFLGGLEVTYSTDAYLVVGAMLATFFLLGMITPRVDYWRLEPNEFVHYIQPWGRDQSIPRQGSTVTRETPDVLEYLLTFGGGSLVIRREGEVAARIEHVPFLGRRMIAIERMLGVTRVMQVRDEG